MSFRYLPRTALPVAAAALLLLASVVPTAASPAPVGGVYTMSNAASGNAVIAYRRDANGSLTHIGDFSTGGWAAAHRDSRRRDR